LADERLIRREILRILDVAYVHGATVELIAVSLCDAGYAVTESEVEEHLVYLGDKGYVATQTMQVRGLGRRLWGRLLPKGQDLLDGNIEDDPGIMPAMRWGASTTRSSSFRRRSSAR